VVPALATAGTDEAAAVRPASARRLALLRLASSLLGLLAVWQIVAMVAGDARLMPGPGPVIVRMWQDSVTGELPFHLGMTLSRVVASFAIAMTLGAAIGYLMGRSRLADDLLSAWLVFFLNLPALVVIILAYIWIGLDETAAIFAVAANKIPNAAVTLREGARALDRGLLEMAQVFGIGRWRTLRHVVLPQLLPFLLAAARSGLALIWKIVLVVELLGRSNGVGFQLGLYFQMFDVTSILAYALAFILVVQLIEWCVLQPLEQAASRWRR
jgi:NitT/TauT family transport system permease protein